MEGSIIFYTYGSTLELYGQQFTAGMLTADLLNLSPDEYRSMSKRMKQITSLAEEYEQSGSIELWWKLNEELAALCGVLRRCWLEQNIGCMALSKDEMGAVRQAQRLYHVAWKDTGEIAEELGISEARVSRYIRYNTHFLGVHDLVPEGYDGDPYERLMPGMLSVSAEQVVYRKVCIELLRELFDALPKKERDILGKVCGVFGYPEMTLKEIGMYHMMKESAVEKAKSRAVEKLRESYPGSRLQVWRAVHRMMRRPVLPSEEDSELRRNFPQYVRALAEVYGVLNEATSDIDNISI